MANELETSLKNSAQKIGKALEDAAELEGKTYC